MLQNPNNAYKMKKLGVSNAPRFPDSHKQIDQPHKQIVPLKKSKYHSSSVTTNTHTKSGYNEQETATFKTKAEKKSMSSEVSYCHSSYDSGHNPGVYIAFMTKNS